MLTRTLHTHIIITYLGTYKNELLPDMKLQ